LKVEAIGANVSISKHATIGVGVRIGANTIIHDRVHIGDHSVVGSNCIVGEPLAAFYTDEAYTQPQTEIGDHAIIRSHSVIYAGSSFGVHFQTGHHVVIREQCTIGDHCTIGTFSDLQGHITMGNYCRLHSSVHLAKGSTLGQYVFIYPYAVLTNDRFPPTIITTAPSIGDYTQIGVHAVVLAGVAIGEHCLIAANATVARNVDDHSFMIGSPAMRKKDVREMKAEDGTALYPWTARFDRGMPWKNDL